MTCQLKEIPSSKIEIQAGSLRAYKAGMSLILVLLNPWQEDYPIALQVVEMKWLIRTSNNIMQG